MEIAAVALVDNKLMIFRKGKLCKKVLINTLYANIDLKLRNKLHGPMHYKIGVTCVSNGHEIYTLL